MIQQIENIIARRACTFQELEKLRGKLNSVVIVVNATRMFMRKVNDILTKHELLS